jgi:site-specific DNA recombinase
MLKDRTIESITDLAEVEAVQRTDASKIVPLAFLAAEITDAIPEGRQSLGLTLDRLLAATPLPPTWNDQRVVLGFQAP